MLAAGGIDVDVVQYLKTPLDAATLRRVSANLDVPVSELVRDDNRFKELGLSKDDYVSVDAVVGLLLEHPELMQRPIATDGQRFVLARPKDKINVFIS